MATNDFLAFAGGSSANVQAQADYAASSAVTNGFQSGVAQSNAVNKALRQSSIMAAVLAQFISDQTGANSVDDGTTATLLANLKLSTNGRLLGVQKFTSSGTYTPGVYAGVTATKAWVRAIGGGGGGGGSTAAGSTTVSLGTGGNAGAYGECMISSGLASATITIGSAGVGITGGTGAAGGSTSFGSLMVCGGGAGGITASAIAPPNIQAAGGTIAQVTGTGNIIVAGAGQQGGMGIAINNGAYISGQGAPSMWGQGGQQAVAAGNNARGYGSGGGGALSALSGAAAAGGTGGPGLLVVFEFA